MRCSCGQYVFAPERKAWMTRCWGQCFVVSKHFRPFPCWQCGDMLNGDGTITRKPKVDILTVLE